MLVREITLAFSGLLAIWVHAAAPVLPELIPAPRVPMPRQNAAEIKITPEMESCSSVRGTKKSSMSETSRQKIMGVIKFIKRLFVFW